MRQTSSLLTTASRSLAAFFLLSAGASLAHAKSQTISHAPWAEVLETYVSPGPNGVNRVDYAALTADEAARDTLNSYIADFEDLDFDALSRDAQFAAWANLYNAVTVRYIVREYPINTIKPWYSSGPWKDVEVTAGGRDVTLHNIEHDILRAQWPDDPRLHYAVNCASYGCPNLRLEPWRAETLDADLDDAAEAYINHPRGVSVRGNGLRVSSIYKWYRDDFGGSEEAVIGHLLAHAAPALAEDIRANPDIRDHEYDWSLNETTD